MKPIRVFWDFLKLWFFMLFTYLTIKVIFNLLYFGWIDLRRATLIEVLFLPLGQAVAFWLITRVRRKKAEPATPV